MAYYVPLGARGFLLRVGTFLIGLMGGVAYRAASRRRVLAGPMAESSTILLPD